jgi:hypothetical protein
MTDRSAPSPFARRRLTGLTHGGTYEHDACKQRGILARDYRRARHPILLPILIGAIRRAEELWLIVFLTVTPTGVSWLAALVLAFAMPRREPSEPYYWEGR